MSSPKRLALPFVMALLAASHTAARDAAAQRAADAGAADDPNILETRTRVAAMAERAIELLESRMQLTGVEGWAVFTGDAMPPDLDAGAGMAESIEGEPYFLRSPRADCLQQGYRHVLVFQDEDLFREFRQGRLDGAALERHRGRQPDAAVMALRFRPAEPPGLEPFRLDGCRFALHEELQRALVAKPSETEGLVEDNDVDVDDN